MTPIRITPWPPLPPNRTSNSSRVARSPVRAAAAERGTLGAGGASSQGVDSGRGAGYGAGPAGAARARSHSPPSQGSPTVSGLASSIAPHGLLPCLALFCLGRAGRIPLRPAAPGRSDLRQPRRPVRSAAHAPRPAFGSRGRLLGASRRPRSSPGTPARPCPRAERRSRSCLRAPPATSWPPG